MTHCIVGKTAGDRSWRSGKPILSAGFHDIRVLFRTKAFVKEGHKIHIKWILFWVRIEEAKKEDSLFFLSFQNTTGGQGYDNGRHIRGEDK